MGVPPFMETITLRKTFVCLRLFSPIPHCCIPCPEFAHYCLATVSTLVGPLHFLVQHWLVNHTILIPSMHIRIHYMYINMCMFIYTCPLSRVVWGVTPATPNLPWREGYTVYIICTYTYYIRIHTQIYIYIIYTQYSHMYICIYVYMYRCIDVYMYIYMYICIDVYMYICIYVYMCIYI